MTQHHVPRARLNEIALRRLRALGLPCGVTAEGRVAGRLPAEVLAAGGRPENPLTGRPLERVDFVVNGHDHLQPVAPPAVRGLPPLEFYSVPDTADLVRRLSEALVRRAGELQTLAAALRAKGLEPRLDGERLLVVLQLELAGAGRVVLEGHRPRMVARTLLPEAGAPRPLAGLELDLDQFDDRTDLELHLSDRLDRAAAAPAAPAAPAAGPGPGRVTEEAAAPGALTLARLVERFGAACTLEGDVLVRELRVDGKPVRFAARHQGGTRFDGRLTTSHGTVWAERFDLSRFPGVEPFVLGLLEAGPAPARQEAPAAREATASAPDARPPGPAAALGGAMLPVAGETWVMDIQVVAEGPEEVRYCAVTATGEPFGAPRVLQRPAFERTFLALGGGAWRLLVEVVSQDGAEVVYRPLDAQRRPSGAARRLGVQVFTATFTAEAAAY